MNKSAKIILLSAIIGIAVWFLNAALDSIVFHAGSFEKMLWSGLNEMQITHRFITVLCFVVFGIIISQTLSRLKSANEELFLKKEKLGKKIIILDCLFGLSKLDEIPELSIDEFFSGVIFLLKPTIGKNINAIIRFEGKEYRVDEFDKSNTVETYSMYNSGNSNDVIELHLLEKENESLDTRIDRQRLLSAIAERTGKIIERRRSKDALKETRDRLRLLTAYLHSSRENERQAIAREIHDELGQVLTALKINLSVIIKQLKNNEPQQSPDYLENEINDMRKILDNTILKVRELITKLRPEVLDNLGIVEALIWQTNVFREQTGIKIDFRSEFDNLCINKDASISLFRIYQESLTNIARHSNAKNVQSSFFKRDNCIILKVEDDGKGITESKLKNDRSFGLLGMRERALICNGNLIIDSKPGNGTKIELIIPENNCLCTEEQL